MSFQALKSFGPMVCKLRFLDNMTKAVDIQTYDCSETVLKNVTEKIELKSVEGWALYEV